MASAGVDRGQSKKPAEGKAGRTSHARSFHSLRHTFNSMMLNKGVAQEIRMKIVGHADSDTNTGYSHAELASLRAAVDLVPSLAPAKAAES
jgi:integrase